MEHRVRKCAQPINLIHEPRAEYAVIAFHGYSGYPGELALIAKLLFESGYDVFVPRYPGHGTDGEDFAATDRSMWVEHALRSYELINGKYKSISAVGHSMGGLIALKVASLCDIPSMVLYAPALLLQKKIPVNLFSFLSHFSKRKAVEWERDPRFPFFDQRDDDDDEFLGKEYWSFIYFRQIAELEKLRKEVLQLVDSIDSRILVFTGGEDTTVDRKVGELLTEGTKGKDNRWIHLPKATHLICYDKDDVSRELAMTESINFLTP
ncbi:MAG: alpha/beta fold hydrolase [Sphaerochaetaceae bacterium]|nr:alpha/beta fold hydrolase [Sphaerochaetaceae bacterium]